MRTSTTLLLTAGLLLAASNAFAQEEDDPPQQQTTPCDVSTYLCSRGNVLLKGTSNEKLGSAVSTGWIPKCGGGEEFCKTMHFKADVSLEPVKGNNGDLSNVYEIVIGENGKNVYVDAHWPTAGTINLSLPPASDQYGRLFVKHGAKPIVHFYINLAGEHRFSFAIDDLINKLPGSGFAYHAEKGTGFVPWAFEPEVVQVNVKGSDLDKSRILSVQFSQILDWINKPDWKGKVEGRISLFFTTDLDFTYQTKKVLFSSAEGVIESPNGSVSIAPKDDDSLQLQPVAEGVLGYSGKIMIRPGVSLEKFLSFSLPDIPINVGANINVDPTEQPVSLTSKEPLIIPLPNVTVDSDPLNFPKTKTGKTSEIKKIAVTNTGLLHGLVNVTSDNPAFKIIQKSATLDPHDNNTDGTFDIEVRFAPRTPGKITGKLTVKTNDPDTPVVTIELIGTAEGKDLGPDPDDEPTGDGGTGTDGSSGSDNVLDSESDSGCGCTVPGSSSNFGAAGAALAALALGTVAARRRRR